MSTAPVTFIDDDPILFVDDNAICSLETTATLRELGYNVVNAYDANGAFDTLSRRTPLGALVTDVDLGPGPDGFEVARVARATYPALAVVFISGTAAGRHVAEGVSGSEFVSKPFEPYEIAEALGRAMAA
ncbi:response regulator [Phenylobacterium sp. 20VBR1]|uniref:Response regulator n=1 Tax=Phenylobacterium glaciei TaxID=2803784 RepID=A0A941HUY9_9CAUL|nr:response regulator [Phenylobacterium glaciei]MBR7618586.1 response regulator [Phenylobacterium glaciei]